APPPPISQAVPRSRNDSDSLDGWLLASLPPPREAPVASPLGLTPPRAVTRPSPSKGDYVKHGVNFSHLLEDAEFERWDAATAEDLQFYLEQTGSFLAEYQQDGRTAAQIIAGAARDHEVNPWVILATLEKESSLVSHTGKPPRGRLKSAMGFGFDDGGSHPGKKTSFAFQVERGTALLRELFEEGRQMSFPRKMTVDFGQRKLTVRNAATHALMRYTPHTTDTSLPRTGGGNYLFRKHFERMQKGYARFYEQAQPTRVAGPDTSLPS
ncbi:MAG: hypothetical protein AB1758_34045, partial [Candidatus Eremiobacterota bacterium]